MSLPYKTRWIRPRLLALLGATLAATAWFSGTHDAEDTSIATASTTPRPSPATHGDHRVETSAAALSHGLARMSARADFPALNATGRRAWSPPTTKSPASASAAAAQAAPAPETPPFPYQWVGLWEQAAEDDNTGPNAPMAVIAGANATRIVKRGDVIDRQWRIEAITPTAVRLVYLPLSSPLTITMTPS